MNATRTEDMTVTDEYGDTWAVIADDGNGNLAIERDTGERWDARQFSHDHNRPRSDRTGTIWYPSQEGSTFGVSCQDEYIVQRTDNAGSLRWVEND